MSGSPEITETRKIKQLDASVVNKIAAGEIIIQPANALKELLENSIDAKSSMIDILVKEGGLKLLQITDNGKGIHKEDLSLLCERFATSKLSKFEDLESIATYGFRGEALASISHISRLSVITKTQDSQLAYKSYYLNGKLVAPGFRVDTNLNNVEPKPIAGKDGTQIIVEDLFYNVPSRLKSFRSKNDEFAKILDVIGRYAVHTSGVGFSCKKFGESHQVLSTRPQLSLKERIRTVLGTAIANELIEFEFDGDDVAEDDTESYKEKLGLVKVSGAITSSNYNNKKTVQPIFFINHRLVSCDPLKRALRSIYQFFLPKGNQPFIYLNLEIKPQNVDVNVHPTKREVRFLHEEEIIEVISGKVHSLLSNVDNSRKFKTQSVLFDQTDNKRLIDESISLQAMKKYRQENKLVRVDALQSKLNSFLSNQTEDNYQRQMTNQFNSQLGEEPDSHIEARISSSDGAGLNINQVIRPSVEPEGKRDIKDANVNNQQVGEEQSQAGAQRNSSRLVSISEIEYSLNDRERTNVNLDSINKLKEEVTGSLHRPLTNIFNKSVYVGIVDEERRLCCFQYDVKLFLCDYAAVLYEFYYQIALAEFCNYGVYNLSEPLSIDDVLDPLYESGIEEEVTKLKPKAEIVDTINSMKEMFDEYFQLNLEENENGKVYIKSIPMIMKDIIPSIDKLPYFFYRLGNSINYGNEKECLEGILRQIALLYIPESMSPPESGIPDFESLSSQHNRSRDILNNRLESVIFPVIKKRFLATKNLLRDVVQIADLPGLYKVFERC